MTTLRCHGVLVIALLGALAPLAGSAATAPPPAAPPRPPAWFAGTWDISYQDALLGEVQGRATIIETSEPGLPPIIRYSLTDPRTGAPGELWPFSIRVQGDEITMTIPPGGPSAAATSNGDPSADIDAALVVRAPAGAQLRAVLGSARAEAPVYEMFSSVSTRLRLTRTGDRLAGEWTVEKNDQSGFHGARVGTRGSEVRHEPPPLGDVTVETMRGPETWTPTRMVVDDAHRLSWQPLNAGPEGPIATARVRIKGRNLPIGFGKHADFRFADPYLQAVNEEIEAGTDANSLILPVRIDRRAIPGAKSFVLTERGSPNQAPGLWVFDWPGLEAKAIYAARRTSESDYEATSMLFQEELFYVEVETREADTGRRSIGDVRGYMIRTDIAPPVFFHLVRVPDRPQFFRAGPFLLLRPEAAVPEGSGASEPALTTNQAGLSSPSEARPFVIRASVGAEVAASPASYGKDDVIRVGTAEVTGADDLGDGPFQKALRRAEEIRRLHPEPEHYEITRYEPVKLLRRIGATAVAAGTVVTSAVVAPAAVPGVIALAKDEVTRDIHNRTYVTVQDHAALLLLYEEMSKAMTGLVRQHTRRLSAEERRAYHAQVQQRWGQGADDPILAQEVPAPNGSGQIMLAQALRDDRLQQVFGGDASRRAAYVERAIDAAEDAMTQALAASKLRMDGVNTTLPEELLPIVKLGYERAAPVVMQRLVRRSRPENGEPAFPRWVPDATGRAAVRGVADLLGAIAADEELASTQWAYIGMATAPVGFVAIPALQAASLGGAAVMLAETSELAMIGPSLHGAYQFTQLWQDADLAQGATPYTGMDAYRQRRSAMWAAGANVAIDLGGRIANLGVKALEAAEAAGRIPSTAAQTSAVQRALAGGIDSLSEAAQSDLMYAIGRAQRRAVTEGIDSLNTLERDALRAGYPDGIPPEVARRLGIALENPHFAVQTEAMAPPAPRTAGTEPGVPTTVPPPPPSEPAASPAPPPPPEASASPVLRRLYAEAEGTARLGVAEAQGRLAKVERTAGRMARLSPAAQGRVNEAMDTLARARRLNPALARIDEADALDYFVFHSEREVYSARGASRDVAPEDMVAEYLRWNRQPIAADELARAANISRPNAEAALFAADARFGGPEPPVVPAASRVVDPHGVTVGGPGAPRGATPADAAEPRRFDPAAKTDPPLPPGGRLAPPANASAVPPPAVNAYEAQVADRLRRMGMSPFDANMNAQIAAQRSADATEAAAAAAFQNGVPAQRVMQELGVAREQLEPMLDNYLRRFDPATAAERRNLLQRFFGDQPTILERPRAAVAPTPTEPNLPRRVEAPPPNRAQAQREVTELLTEMGVPPRVTEQLKPEEIFPRGVVDPREAAAAAARRLQVPAQTAERVLGATDQEYAGLLDRQAAASQPGLSPARRGVSIASDLAAGGMTEPYRRILAARQAQVDAALRDFGVPRGDPTLTARGVDPESAIVGEALTHGATPEVVMARRGLSREQFNQRVDDFVRNAEGVTDAAARVQRTQRLTNPLAANPGESTVRLPPAVIASAGEVEHALIQVGVDPALAAQRADELANLAPSNAHEAIVVGAWRSGVPPASLRSQFGLSEAQIAGSLDHYLQHYGAMADAAERARVIAAQWSARAGQPMAPDRVAAMVREPVEPLPPLHGRPTGNPPRPPTVPPPPPPLSFPPPASSATAGEVVAGLPRREWAQIQMRRAVNRLNYERRNEEFLAANARYKREFPGGEADEARFGQRIGTIARSADGRTLTVDAARLSPYGEVHPLGTFTIPLTAAPVDLGLGPGETERFSYTLTGP